MRAILGGNPLSSNNTRLQAVFGDQGWAPAENSVLKLPWRLFHIPQRALEQSLGNAPGLSLPSESHSNRGRPAFFPPLLLSERRFLNRLCDARR